MNKEIFYLYRIHNLITHKIYIGQTIDPDKRWRRHLWESENPQYPIHFAIAKYGKMNFKFEIIACCLDKNSANQIEERLIVQYGSHLSDGGYNCTFGGDGSYGFKHSEKPKLKMSANTKQLYASGKFNPQLGKKRTEKSKKKMSQSALGNKSAIRKLTDTDVMKIKQMLKNNHTSASVAKLFKVSKAAISHIKRGINWKHITV